ncbi:MAG TPA: MnhB domain-containing protein [Lachnospiraceae bacterium]|nr:MnhB domain-containing protein [Lachnospiraceae bacterium]HPF29292.1 MnhB domain-containing protein [Lachnospiraceae bacterium]
MSKLKQTQDYEKTASFKFFRWISGEKDPYIGTIEMQEQSEHQVEDDTITERMWEKQMIIDEIYDVDHNRILTKFHKLYKIAAVLFCVALTFFLLLTVSYLPRTGNAANPDNNEVAQRYIESGLQETGAVNIVSGMILTYRAFDTFGETNVLFIATVCVMILLMVDEKTLEERSEARLNSGRIKDDIILQMTAKFLVPFILIFGIYVILNGQNSPGGGFSGGAILGAGLILYANAFGIKPTQRFFNEKVYRIAKVSALCMYGCIGLYYYTMGANHLADHIPNGIPGHILSGGIILPIDICVGLEVACTMYAFYALFKRGGL